MDSTRSGLPVVAVVLGGGSGTRVGLGVPKQLLKVAGKTVIEHTLDVLESSDVIDEIVVVMARPYLDRLTELLQKRYAKIRKLLPGGDSRNSSTSAAIAWLGSRECKVLFHDAVRPFVDSEILMRCVEALNVFDAVDVVIESADTIVAVDETGAISDIPNRKYLRRGQTPQGFLLSTIRQAYSLYGSAGGEGLSDDCSVVLKYLPDRKIGAVDGSEQNIKITYPLDLYLADRLFQFASFAPHASSQAEAYIEGLRGKTVVVFGGSYGIGNAIVTLARSYGANAYSFSRSQTETDIRDPSGVEKALAEVAVDVGEIDVVINAAAILTRGALVEMSVAGIQEQIDVNLTSPTYIARAALPYLRRTRGHLLFFTSSSYTRGRAEYSLYSATKAAVVNLTQALSDEWSAIGVRVNCINPERTRTPMRFQNFGAEPENSLLSAEAVAHSALDVILSNMTGQVVDVRRLDDAGSMPSLVELESRAGGGSV